MSFAPEILDRLEKLKLKYESMGQDMISYLDGLLYADYLTYWDYIHLDTLLSLQTPRTSFPDERIFIIYHQLTELYFRLALYECEQIAELENPEATFLTERMNRMNRYFENLTHSFDIMVDGMEKEQFLKYRMALLPASGFQSGQYRMIEIYSTDFINLIHQDKRAEMRSANASIDDMYEHMYWKKGATELATGNKTLTLVQFENKYSDSFIRLAKSVEKRNLWSRYEQLQAEGKITPALTTAYRQFDLNVNVNWPLSHFKSAVRYLHRSPQDIKATGGTNWQKYLPPRYQKRIFYPEIWSEEEKERWGKSWVEKVIGEV